MTDVAQEGNERDSGVVEEVCGYLTSEPPRSFFLFAGAGSGKTRTLVEVLRRLTGLEPHDGGARTAKRLDARGQSVRVVTYTRNAVAVIAGRLGENPLAKTSTIHSFCWDLIGGFDDDIRDALLELNSKELSAAQAKVAKRKNGATAKDREDISELQRKACELRAIPRFVYHPDQDTYGEGALQHAQVLKIAAQLLCTRPTLARILAGQHPIILIDESQDTMSGMLTALMAVAREQGLIIGFLGDHRQRIYPDGHQDLPGIIPDDWARPVLAMNHRSQRRIVKLINAIWDSEPAGRTQSKTGVPQHPRSEKSAGVVRVFVGDASVPTADKVRAEKQCADAMRSAIANSPRLVSPVGYQVLALEHTLAAKRGGFSGVFEAVTLIDPDASRPKGNGESAGPAATKALIHDVTALADCIEHGERIDEFSAIAVLNRFERLKDVPEDDSGRRTRLAELQQGIAEFASACGAADATVRDVISPIARYRVFDLGPHCVAALRDTSSTPAAPVRAKDEPTSERRRRGWHALLSSRWREVQRYRSYLEGSADVSTHQVVKGSEFDHVMVIMDDEEAGGFLFAYDKLFGAVPLSDKDKENVGEGKETTVDRTLRLLYVTCSRAMESLALVLWSRNPEAALDGIRRLGWFSEDEISKVPEA